MSTVLYEQKDRIVTITINRPEAMNSVDPETQQALIDAWIRFRDDDGAWVAILTGAGDRAFSAGADLKKLIPAAFGKGRTGMHNTYGLGGISPATSGSRARTRPSASPRCAGRSCPGRAGLSGSRAPCRSGRRSR